MYAVKKIQMNSYDIYLVVFRYLGDFNTKQNSLDVFGLVQKIII